MAESTPTIIRIAASQILPSIDPHIYTILATSNKVQFLGKPGSRKIIKDIRECSIEELRAATESRCENLDNKVSLYLFEHLCSTRHGETLQFAYRGQFFEYRNDNQVNVPVFSVAAGAILEVRIIEFLQLLATHGIPPVFEINISYKHPWQPNMEQIEAGNAVIITRGRRKLGIQEFAKSFRGSTHTTQKFIANILMVYRAFQLHFLIGSGDSAVGRVIQSNLYERSVLDIIMAFLFVEKK